MVEYIGRQLGDYRIIEEIRTGGMGRVFLAENVHHRKRYALKVLPEELGNDASFRQRFFNEARVMSELDHPNIVKVHHMGEDNGIYYLVMDYVTTSTSRPCSLHDRLAQSYQHRIAQPKALRWIIQIADGLAYAHQKGVIHRDIKPSNILIDAEDKVKIADFGLVKTIGTDFILSRIHRTIQESSGHEQRPPDAVVNDVEKQETLGVSKFTNKPEASDEKHSDSSGILGTYDYMSPEQLEAREVDERSDIYSFGVTIYRILTGKRTVGMPKSPSEIVPRLSKRWDIVVDRCLEEDPDDRYQSVESLLADLYKITGSRQRWVIAVVGLTIIMLVAGAILLNQYVIRRMRATSLREQHQKIAEVGHEKPREPPLEQVTKEDKAKEDVQTQKTVPEKTLPKTPQLAQPEASRAVIEAVVQQETLTTNGAQKDACYKALTLADSARQSAINEQAPKYALNEWNSAEQSYEKGESTLEQGEFERSLTHLQSAILSYTKARRLARLAKAEIEYKNALENSIPEKLAEVESEKQSFMESVQSAMAAGNFDDAVEYYQRAIRLLHTIRKLTNEKTIILPNGLKLEFVLITAGEFNMGSVSTEDGSQQDEWVVHRVKITESFYLGKYEVTQSQYKAIVGENPSFYKDDNCPVENVSWYDAQEFCRKLSTLTGGHFRLPMEAEWEYACRAGTTTAYCNGSGIRSLKRVGWCSYDGKRGSSGRPKPVGQFEPNRWGVYDMHGNVWEWCQDWYGQYSYTAASDPNGTARGTDRVVRGGSWYTDPLICRCATRNALAPTTKENSLGFRVVYEKE